MSSILRALRRAEGQPIGTRWVWPLAWRRDSGTSSLPRWAFIVMGCFVLATGVGGVLIGYWWIGGDPLPDDGAKTAVAAAPMVPASEAPQPNVVPVPERPPLPEAVVGPPDSAFLESVAKTVNEENTKARRSLPRKSSQGSPDASASKVSTKAPSGAPDLLLQAVIWAPAPEDRMVVINNRFLHIGDQEADVRIQAISKDTVVFRWRGSEWQKLHSGASAKN